MTIGARLREAIENKGMLTTTAAELTGQKIADIEAWLKNKKEPHAQALARFAALGVDIYFVLTGKIGVRDENESDLIRDYRQCDSEARESLLKAAAECAAKEEADKIDLSESFTSFK